MIHSFLLIQFVVVGVDVEVVEVEPEIILKHYYNDPDVQAKLIQAVKARPPLWNYKIKLKDRSENIKRILWDEIFVEMGGNLKCKMFPNFYNAGCKYNFF